MCPECLASATALVAGILSSGGLAALVAKVVSVKKVKESEQINTEREK